MVRLSIFGQHKRSSFDENHTGFTIAELVIVVAVIGILAGIAAVAYEGMEDRARAVAIVKNFKETEEALNLMAANERASTWWLDETWWIGEGTGYTGPHNPQIKDVIATTNLKKYLKQAPSVKGLESSFWRYDNDAVLYDPDECQAASDGVNIMITNVSQNVAQQVDKISDDGDLDCGKVRLDTTSPENRLLYLLSHDQKF